MVHKMLIYIMYHNHPNIFFLWIKKLRLTAWGRGHAIFLLTPSCSAVTLWSCLLLVNSNLSSRSYVSLTTENTLLWTVPIVAKSKNHRFENPHIVKLWHFLWKTIFQEICGYLFPWVYDNTISYVVTHFLSWITVYSGKSFLSAKLLPKIVKVSSLVIHVNDSTSIMALSYKVRKVVNWIHTFRHCNLMSL